MELCGLKMQEVDLENGVVMVFGAHSLQAASPLEVKSYVLLEEIHRVESSQGNKSARARALGRISENVQYSR